MSDDHDQLDPAEALMREVGAQLRQVRMERGEELDEVAQQLRIKATYLFGIEQGDLSTIPGRTYALGFLRSYADYLGFDGDDLISQIKSTVANLTDKTRLRIRTPLPESRLPKTPLLVLSLATVAGIYAGWSYVNHGSQLVIETVAEVPGNLRNLALGAFREPGEAGGLPAPAADAGRAGPRAAVTLTEPMVQEPGPAVARAAPLPGPSTTAPAPEAHAPSARAVAPTAGGYPPAARAAMPGSSGARAPAGLLEPGPPPVPAIVPQAGPEPPTGAVEPDAGSAAPEPREHAPIGPAAPDRALAEAAPEVRPSAPERAGAAAASERPPLVVAAAPADPVPVDEGPGAGAEAGPAEAGPAAPADPAQLAALPLDPALIGPVGRIHEPDNTDARVVIRALDSSWIQITSAAGDYLRDRTLEPGDLFLVPNRPDLALWTGNAGGLELIVDGTALAALGDKGAIVRDVPLDPPSLRVRFGPPVIR